VRQSGATARGDLLVWFLCRRDIGSERCVQHVLKDVSYMDNGVHIRGDGRRDGCHPVHSAHLRGDVPFVSHSQKGRETATQRGGGRRHGRGRAGKADDRATWSARLQPVRVLAILRSTIEHQLIFTVNRRGAHTTKNYFAICSLLLEPISAILLLDILRLFFYLIFSTNHFYS